MTRFRWPLLLAALLPLDCGGAPQTDPPNFRPTLQPGLVQVHSTKSRGAQMQLVGGVGAATPAGATLRIVDLDSQDAEVSTTIGADGTFSANIVSATGHTLRLQVVSGSERSQPMDLVIDATGLRPALPGLDCWTMAPQAELPFGDLTAASVELRNSCDQAISVSAVRPRLNPSAFSVAETPTLVAPGSVATMRLAYSPSGSNRDEDILLVEISSPATDRRAITLIGK